jgi:putative hydrolase of the HAD superfamily
MRYPVVLFDVGETLVGPRESFGAVYARVLRTLGLELEPRQLERGIRDVMREVAETIPAGTDRYRYYPGGEDEYWLRFVRRTLQQATGSEQDGVAARSLEALRDAFRGPSAWKIYDDVLPALDALRDAGVTMGVVSNWDSRLPDLLRTLDLADYFQTVGVSHVEGIEKPAPAFFHRIVERMSVEARDVLHVGDRPEMDLEGARAAGVDAVIVDRRGRLEGTEVPRVGDLRELLPIVLGRAP